MAQRGVHGGDDGHGEGGGEIDLRALGRGLWRRKLWIIGPTVCAAVAAFVFVQLSSPYFRSTALVLIENRDGAAPRSGPERDAPLPDEQAVMSQAQLIQSRDLVRTVVAKLGLAKVPEFASPNFNAFDRVLDLIGIGGSADMPLNERVVDKVAKNLTVYPVTGSRVIGLEFVSVDADLASQVVNGFVDAFLDIQRGAKRETNKQASQYLSDEIASLRGRVAAAEDRVEEFRSKAGLLVGTNNTTVVAQQLSDAANQLQTTRTQQADAQAKSEMIRTVLRQGRPSEALEIANSDLVRQLAQQRSQLAAQIASESRTLLPQHPRMRELSAQLGGLEDQIRREAEKLAKAFENDAKTAGARVAALSRQLDTLKSSASQANGQDVQLRALEREARSQRDLFEQLLARYGEANARDNPEALLADARVISRGAAATEPYFPKKGPTIALATLAAFVLALFGVASVEAFGGRRFSEDDDGGEQVAPPAALRASTPQTVEPVLTPGPPVAPVASVAAFAAPAATAERKPEISAAEPVPVAPPATVAVKGAEIECADATLLSALARQLAAMPTGAGALRILATGAKDGLGVAGVASKLAATISESGRRVVAIDAGGGAPLNGGRPSAPGLSELLTGDATFAQAIHRDRGARVHVVPQGARPFAQLDAAAQDRLGMVLEALSLTYDFVMLTTPSGPGAADSFARHCGAAVLISGEGAADDATIAAHDRLKATGIDDVVVLLVNSDGGDAPRGKSLAA